MKHGTHALVRYRLLQISSYYGARMQGGSVRGVLVHRTQYWFSAIIKKFVLDMGCAFFIVSKNNSSF